MGQPTSRSGRFPLWSQTAGPQNSFPYGLDSQLATKWEKTGGTYNMFLASLFRLCVQPASMC